MNYRFAPSPTGKPHLGHLYILSWILLYKNKNQGKLILRFDDTDITRTVNKSEESFLKMFSDFNITFDKIIYQSKRKNFYNQIINDMLKKNMIYYCDCSYENLNNLKIKNLPYNGHCRYKKKETGVLRFINDINIETNDILRGKMKSNEKIGDTILVREDGSPTYHLASCIDDFLFSIKTIIRSVEWLPYINLHMNIFKSLSQIFGFNYIPEFLHLPMIMNADGSKLSKRYNSIDIEYLLDQGYLPEALTNYCINLSAKTETEIFNIYNVDIQKISKNSPKIDFKKIDWFNRKYIQQIDTFELKNRLKKWPLLINENFNLLRYIEITKKSYSKMSDFFYNIELILDDNKFKKIFPNLKFNINEIKFLFKKIETFDNFEIAQQYIKNTFEPNLLKQLRKCLIGTEVGINIIIFFICFEKKMIENRLLYIINNLREINE